MTKEMPATVPMALSELCNNEKFVFLGYNNFVLHEPSPCRVVKIPNEIFTTTTSMRLHNDLPFKRIFNIQ